MYAAPIRELPENEPKWLMKSYDNLGYCSILTEGLLLGVDPEDQLCYPHVDHLPTKDLTPVV
jgi:hypothetical protein